MPIDDQKIIEKFSKAEKYMTIAKNLVQNSVEVFNESYELQLQGERVFEILSQILLDICTHIVGNMAHIEPPTTYSECMIRLSEIGVIPKDKVNVYVEIVKMRNFIVHQYSDIDYMTLYQSLQSLIDDFEAFKNYVIDWIQKNNDYNF